MIALGESHSCIVHGQRKSLDCWGKPSKASMVQGLNISDSEHIIHLATGQNNTCILISNDKDERYKIGKLEC